MFLFVTNGLNYPLFIPNAANGDFIQRSLGVEKTCSTLLFCPFFVYQSHGLIKTGCTTVAQIFYAGHLLSIVCCYTNSEYW